MGKRCEILATRLGRFDPNLSLAEDTIPNILIPVTAGTRISQYRVLAVIIGYALEAAGIDPCLRTPSAGPSTLAADVALGVAAALHVAELVAAARVGPLAGDVAVDNLAPERTNDRDGGAESGDEVFGSRVDEHVNRVD